MFRFSAILLAACLCMTFASDCLQSCSKNRDVTVRRQTATPLNDVEAFYKVTRRHAGMKIDDLTFLRRTTLDLTGRLPSPEVVQAFLNDSNNDKRATYIDQLLQSQAYVHRWTTFLEDLFDNKKLIETALFRNDFEAWLRQQLTQNTPYDELVTDLLTTTGSHTQAGAMQFFMSDFTQFVFRMDSLDDRTAHITRSMLGIDTNCISCHDGAYHLESVNKGLSVMTREQFWGMAAFLADTYIYLPENAYYDPDEPLGHYTVYQVRELDGGLAGRGHFFNVDTPLNGEYNATSEPGQGTRVARNGGIIPPRYLDGQSLQYPERRRHALARLITTDRQFVRNIVNRLWSEFFGEGFVPTLDAWDLGRLTPDLAATFETMVQARNHQLMEHLCDVFIELDYDLKAFMRFLTNHHLY